MTRGRPRGVRTGRWGGSWYFECLGCGFRVEGHGTEHVAVAEWRTHKGYCNWERPETEES